MSKTVALIPVRGGSKSIPLKNIKTFNGRPLVYWVLFAANNSKYIDEVFVSTDSIEIKRIVEEFGFPKTIVLKRKKSLAKDTTSTELVMLDFAKEYKFDNIVLLQATSPMTTTFHIDEAIKKYFDDNPDSLLSVVRTHRFIWEQIGTFITPVNYDYKNRFRRQDWDGQLVENGAIYITKKKMLIQSNSRISGDIIYYMMPDFTYFEIDELTDWNILEGLHNLHNKNIIFASLKSIIKDIKLVVTDVDGVLTNGNMIYIGDDLEGKEFNAKDGMGFEILRRNQINCAIVTGESNVSVTRRAKKLKVNDVYTGIQNKTDVIIELTKKYDLNLNQIAYIGDDINDLDAMKIVGLSVAVADAVVEIKRIAKLILLSNGGRAAFREFVDYFISVKNSLDTE